MSASQKDQHKNWNVDSANSHHIESGGLEEASWELSPTIPNSYLKDHEDKSLLGPNESHLSLHDVILETNDFDPTHRSSNQSAFNRCKSLWNRFKKTQQGKLSILACKSIALLLFIWLLIKEVVYIFSPTSPETRPPDSPNVCNSKLWSNGRWEKRNATSMPLQPPIWSVPQAMKISNFPADMCASNRLPLTNTAMPRMENDTAEFWDWRYRVSSYRWRSGCETVGIPAKPHPTAEELLQTFVNEGGWMMIGDSLSAQWFMSLSCYLAPYVRAVPVFTTQTPWNATQHLYLNNASTFVQNMKLPADFDINTTPLVSILRSGLLLAKTQIKDIIETNKLITDDKPMFGPEKVFDMHPDEYTADFLNPKLRYSKMIASAGAHYTQLLFQDRPFHQIAEIFHHNFEHWTQLMIKVLKDPRSKNKKIYYRTATAGHDKCYLERARGPWNEELVLATPVWNWPWIPMFNKIADAVLSSINGPKPELLSLERPAMLRPDAHIIIDCLHFTVGSGIIEGWTDYVYNYS